MIEKDPPQAGDGATTEATVNAFNQAFNRHDVDGVMSLMTDDCLFENTLPRPDGERHIGQAAVRRFWDKFFGDTPRARFETEEMVVAGDRATVCWLSNEGCDTGAVTVW